MGVNFSLLTPTAPSVAVSAYVDVLENVQYQDQLSSSRFLKTVKAIDPNGSIVIKVFIKPNESIALSKYKSQLLKQKKQLEDLPNVLSFSKIIETDRAGYLIRQHLKTNIYDRLSIRPFLNDIEKKWIVFQLLNCVNDCHELNICHGDIKTENILVTSWNWILLTDFASYKPVYLPEDNPGSFSFYFDTSQRRCCYLAPERFLNSVEFNEELNKNAELNEKMDIFSLGCTIAEILLEGLPIFTLSQLYKYKKAEFIPDLSGIKDKYLREMVENMISLDPNDRLSAKEYLSKYKNLIFDDNFYTFIYEYFKSLSMDLNTKLTGSNLSNHYDEQDFKISKIYNDFDKISYFLNFNYEVSNKEKHSDDTILIPMKLSLPGIPKNYILKSTSNFNSNEINDTCLIFLNFIFSTIRSVLHENSKFQALELILAFSERISDEDKLDRSLPFIISLFNDPSINIQAMSLKSLTQLLLIVDSINQVNIHLFTDFILPRLNKFLNHSNSYNKMIFANCLPYLSQTCLKFHEMSIILQDNFINSNFDPQVENFNKLNLLSPLNNLKLNKKNFIKIFEFFTISILTDSNPNVKISLLRNLLPLCSFFGKEKTNDLILSHLITYLNDKNPLLRIEFIESVVGLSIYVGITSLEHYILPLLVQTLTDPEELVVIRVLHIFQNLSKLRLIRQEYLYDLLKIVSKLLLHPNEWIRQSSLSLIVSIAETLTLADCYCLLYPIIRPYIDYDVTDFSWDTLFKVCKRPISRTIYNLSCTWSLRSEKTLFWKPIKNSKLDAFGNEGVNFMSSRVINGKKNKLENSIIINNNLEIPLSSEDKIWVDKLISSGLNQKEFWKIEDLREYIFRVSKLSSRINNRNQEKSFVEIKHLDILPKNVFFDSKFKSEIFTNSDTRNNSKTGNNSSTTAVISNIMDNEETNQTEINNDLDIDDRMNNEDETITNKQTEDISSLMLGNISKASPSLTMNQENVFGELDVEHESHLHERSRKFSQHLNSDNVLSETTNSYMGNDPYVLKFLSTIEIEPSLEQFREFDQSIKDKNVQMKQEWIPKGDLVSQLKEHKSSVNSISISSDYGFFVSGDNDGSVKIWDTKKIERNVTPSSDYSVELDSPVIKVEFLLNFNIFGVITKDGSVRIIKIKNKNDKDISVSIIREFKFTRDNEYGLGMRFGELGYKHYLYVSTSLSKIICFDIRMMTIVFELNNQPSNGIITSFTIDSKNSWLVSVTNVGIIMLWDLRFQLLLKRWKFKQGGCINKVVSVSNDYHLNRKKGRFVVLIGGTNKNDVTIWDINKGVCREIFSKEDVVNIEDYHLIDLDNEGEEEVIEQVIRDVQEMNLSGEKTSDDNSATSLDVIEKFVDGVKKFWIICGCKNYEIMKWDVYDIGKSQVVLSHDDVNSNDVKASYTYQQNQITPSLRIISEKKVTEVVKDKRRAKSRTTLISAAQDSLIKQHHDKITCVGMLLRPYELIVSCDRAGTIKLIK